MSSQNPVDQEDRLRAHKAEFIADFVRLSARLGKDTDALKRLIALADAYNQKMGAAEEDDSGRLKPGPKRIRLTAY